MPPSPAVKGCFAHSRSHLSWAASTSYVARSVCCSLIGLSRSRLAWSRAQKNPPWQGGWPLGAIWSGDRSERLSKEKAREHVPQGNAPCRRHHDWRRLDWQPLTTLDERT